jgi:hypothetical protein
VGHGSANPRVVLSRCPKSVYCALVPALCREQPIRRMFDGWSHRRWRCLNCGTGAIQTTSVVLRLAIMICAVLGSTDHVHAVTVFQKSVFTTIDRTTCEIIRKHPDGNAYRCPGLIGYPIYLAEGDDRTFIASSTKPEKSAAATQTLGAFNTPFRKRGERATVEWRFIIKDKRRVPFAMIVRYFTEMDGRKGEVLVVSRIDAAEACHVAYIDALANPDGIVLARKIADERARTFSCASQATVEGLSGKSPM